MTIDSDSILRKLYPVPENQDGNCPHIEWEGLGHNSGIGEWKCKHQSYR